MMMKNATLVPGARHREHDNHRAIGGHRSGTRSRHLDRAEADRQRQLGAANMRAASSRSCPRTWPKQLQFSLLLLPRTWQRSTGFGYHRHDVKASCPYIGKS
eukprot:8190200-Pyramimonas_sp.AAC.1